MGATQSAARTTTRAYGKAVHDHFNNPRNIGKLDAKKVNVGTGMVGAPACGDVMKLMIEVDDAGKTVDQAQAIRNTDIAQELSLPPVKLHCSVLAEDAIKERVSNFLAINLFNFFLIFENFRFF